MKGRFAPSPSGRMHLGNIYTALMSWLSVRRQGGSWLLRIEDLDPQRSTADYARKIEDDLHWLGLNWDEGGIDADGPAGPYCQSRRSEIYECYLALLEALGYTYPCHCTRAEIMATQAPHQSDGRVIYSGHCRPDRMPGGSTPDPLPHATRLWVPDREIRFDDLIAGAQSFNLARDCGDFVLRRADGAWSYQLAVVIDDALMGVTEVMRGRDLLLSAAQQIYLYELLGFPVPQFAHLPLLCNESGQRLSKRDKSQSMAELRLRYSPEQLIGHLGHIAGLLSDDKPCSLEELVEIASRPRE